MIWSVVSIQIHKSYNYYDLNVTFMVLFCDVQYSTLTQHVLTLNVRYITKKWLEFLFL